MVVYSHNLYSKNSNASVVAGRQDETVLFFSSFRPLPPSSSLHTVCRYYSASIIQMAGFPDRDAIWLAAIPAFGNFIFTILGLILVDRIGRRKLLLGSSAGVIFSLALLGAAFYVMDVESPEATPRQRDHCDLTSCGACVGNSQCGFCVDHVDDGSFVNGTCTPAEEINREMMSKYRTPNRTCLLYFETTPTDMTNSKFFASEFDTLPDSNSSSDDRERRWFFTSCPNSKLASLTIVVLFIYIAFFAPGMGPLPWTINAEIYPTWARSTAIAIATTVNWLCNLIVSMTFLTLTDRCVLFRFSLSLSMAGVGKCCNLRFQNTL